jgi:hypothetical protein
LVACPNFVFSECRCPVFYSKDTGSMFSLALRGFANHQKLSQW